MTAPWHQTARIYIPAFRAARAALVAQGYPVRAFADAEITSFLGLNIHDMWRSFLPQAPAEVQAKGARIIGSALDAALAHGNAALYPGIPEALYALKRAGHTLVLLSNCRHSYGEAARARFGLDRWFSGYYFCEDYQNVPKEEIFPAISQAFPGPYLMIGDRTTDRPGGPDARLRLCGLRLWLRHAGGTRRGKRPVCHSQPDSSGHRAA